MYTSHVIQATGLVAKPFHTQELFLPENSDLSCFGIVRYMGHYCAIPICYDTLLFLN